MKALIKALDDLPLIVKIILCLPALDIIWCISRVCRSVVKNNVLGIVLGILTIFPGVAFVWIIDLITVILTGKIWWID